MNRKTLILFAAAVLTLPALPRAAGPSPMRLVAAAPGYPGTTEVAQPTMDRFALAASEVIGLRAGALTAVYDPDEKGGAARIAAEGTALALVPLPFYLRHREELRLEPLLVASRSGAPVQVFSLFAAKGAIEGPASLAGWTIAGTAGYAPAFVRGPLFASWGPIPADTEIRFETRILPLLRKASAGGKIAVLLDEAQAAAVRSLSFASKLEVVARSEPVPEALLCAVAGRLDAGQRQAVREGMLALHEQSSELLSAMQIRRFLPLDEAKLAAVEQAYDAVR